MISEGKLYDKLYNTGTKAASWEECEEKNLHTGRECVKKHLTLMRNFAQWGSFLVSSGILRCRIAVAWEV